MWSLFSKADKPNKSSDGVAKSMPPVAITGAAHVTRDTRWRLRSCLPNVTPQDLLSAVTRVRSNLEETPDTQSKMWGAWYSKVFKRALPFSACNPDKCGVMLELLPTVGTQPLYTDVWKALALDSPNPMVLLTGTSGMGKTKAAYDIGQHHACVVMMRLCERSQLTLPWNAAIRFIASLLMEVFPAMNPAAWSVRDRGDAVKCILLYAIGAHLEYVVDVCETLKRSCGASPEPNVIREVVLRAQRNGLAYRAVCSRFTACIDSCLQIADVPLTTLFTSTQAITYIRELMRRFTDVCGDDMPVVFVYDHAQALLDTVLHQLPADVGEGCYTTSSPTTATDARPAQGIFHGLLSAIRALIDGGGFRAGHLLLANRWNVEAALFDPHSPAQGVAQSIHRAFNLTSKDIYELLGKVLHDDVLASLAENDSIPLLGGRPLFAAQLLLHLVSAIMQKKHAPGDPSPAEVYALVAKACQEAADGAVTDAITRLEACGDMPQYADQEIPTQVALVRRLMHHVIMHDGEPFDTTDLKDEMEIAVTRGILNVDKCSVMFDATLEPATAIAVKKLAVRLIHWNCDGVMRFLAAALPHAAAESKGEVSQKCLAWYLVRTCIDRADLKVPLDQLLVPLLASSKEIQLGVGMGGVSDDCLPECMRGDSGWTAHITCGKRGGNSSFTSLDEKDTRLIHHPADEMEGPDIMFLAKHESGAVKLVGIQVKHRRIGGLQTAMKALQHTNWKTDAQQMLAKHPEWKDVVRCVAGAQSFDPAVLRAACRFNTCGGALQSSPVLFLTPSLHALKVDVMCDAAASCYGPSAVDWPKVLWPPGVDAEACYPSCSVVFRGVTKKYVRYAVDKVEHDHVGRCRVKVQVDGTYAATVRYPHFAYAIDAVRKAGARFIPPPKSTDSDSDDADGDGADGDDADGDDADCEVANKSAIRD